MIDERGRLFGIVNVFDLLVVLVVLAVVSWGASRYLQGQVTTADTQPVEIVVLVEAVRTTPEAVEAGAPVVATETNAALGEVVDKRTEPAVVLEEYEDGRLVQSTSEVFSDLWITVRGQGRVTPNVITISGQEVRVGTELNLRGNKFAVRSTVMEVNTSPPER